MAVFIAVPLKKTYDTDLVKPLKNILSGFPNVQDSQDNYSEALQELNKLRTNAVCKTLDRHESSLEVIYRYYDTLNALESKIPPQDIQVPFKWKDAFDKGGFWGGKVSLTVASLAYEKVCVLFNVAALQSQVASDQNLDNDDGLRLATKLFQTSCGIFTSLKNSVMSSVQQDPTTDLQPDALNALASLMLAQAQETFFHKATQDNMKDLVVAKIASQCEDLYADALKLLQRDSVRTLWDKDWIPMVAGKQAVYHALAEFHQAAVAKTQKNIGEELARLTLAAELIKQAESRAGSVYNVKDISIKIQRVYDEAKKDNDFIYHERVPDVKTLASVGKAALAKPIALGDHLSANFKDMFSSLVPVAVHQVMSLYEARRSELVNAEIAKLRDLTQLMNSILASLNLPAALEDMSGESLPQSLADKAKAVRDRGGIEAIEKLINELPELLQRNKEILDEAERMLNDEQQSDAQLRAQFKERWTRSPSEKLTEPMRVSASKYRQIITTAMQADGVVKEKCNSHRKGVIILTKSPGELHSAIPSANPTKALQSSPVVQKLRSLMMQVENIKAERDAIEAELKNANVDIKSRVLSDMSRDGGLSDPAVYNEILAEIYGPLQSKVRESDAKQQKVMAEVEAANVEFCKEKNNNQSASTRENTLKELAAAHDAYMELIANLQEGTKFYNDLTQLLLNFQNKVSDFCFARKTEKEELMRDLQKTIAYQPGPEAPSIPAHHTAASSSEPPRQQPPPRPPPPVPVPAPRSTNVGPSGSSAPVPTAAGVAPPLPPQQQNLQPSAMPYPMAPSMPMPHPYSPYPAYPNYPSYAPVPQGYNPYANAYAPPGYGYPQQPPNYGTYPGAHPSQHVPLPPHPSAYPPQQWH
ncbi:hypothetical protein CHUAL_010402 [Chamberlinius hualienensis]